MVCGKPFNDERNGEVEEERDETLVGLKTKVLGLLDRVLDRW